MHLEIHLDTDNAAFGEQPDEIRAEATRSITRGLETLDLFAKAGHQHPLRDLNGNMVGWILLA